MIRTPLRPTLFGVMNHTDSTIEMRTHSNICAFKVRGALNKVLKLDEPTARVVAASTGNHGLRFRMRLATPNAKPPYTCLEIPTNDGSTGLNASVHPFGWSVMIALRQNMRLANLPNEKDRFTYHRITTRTSLRGGTGLELFEQDAAQAMSWSQLGGRLDIWYGGGVKAT